MDEQGVKVGMVKGGDGKEEMGRRRWEGRGGG